ncbi:hypothetical protein JCM8202v2_005889 [Rhodotorula sphaerocarpa]
MPALTGEATEAPQLTAFARAGEFLAGVKRLSDDTPDGQFLGGEEVDDGRLLEALCAMLDEYQEQSYLLDPSLESMVSPLMATFRHTLQHAPSKRQAHVAKLLYWLCKVRGAKTVARLFPHDIQDLSMLVGILALAEGSASSSSTGPERLHSSTWETRYILLLWLSVCVRLPFSFSLLAPGTETKLVHMGVGWIGRSGKESDAAAEVLGQLYARNDVDLTGLLDRCESALTLDDSDPSIATALLSALALVLSTASANRLLGFFPRLYSLLAFLPDPDDGRAGASFAKWRTKVAGRIALLRLQHRDAEGSVPKEVEVIVGELLHGLSHPDTVPRYSAAKYLARLALQMPPDSAVEVMVAVLDVFEDALGEDARKAGEVKVQGACLAVGEMTRRGLLARLPAEDRSEVMQRVLDYSLKALRYDHLNALHAVGTSVRDSAAYVVWSLSRSMPASSITSDQAHEIAVGLLCTACLDRDVSVRRAASAAWQEAVGRWGIFPHGIESLSVTDFFTVSVRHRAYLQGAVGIAGYEEYRPAMLGYLTSTSSGETGLSHYDPDLRRLSAQALGKIAENKADGVVPVQVDLQLENLPRFRKDWAKLQGVLLALAALADATKSLSKAEQAAHLRIRIFDAVCGLYPETRSLKSQSTVLEAALLALAAAAPSQLDTSRHASGDTWIEILRLAGERTEPVVHERAAEALERITRIIDGVPAILRLLDDLDARADKRQQATACMLGRLNFSSPSIAPRFGSLVSRMSAFARPAGRGAASSVEGRRNGVEALGRLVQAGSAEQGPKMEPDEASAALETLSLGFSDFTNDFRGDVGSWIRIATAKAWSPILAVRQLTSDETDRVVACMARLALERLDSVRKVAGGELVRIATLDGPNERHLLELKPLRDLASQGADQRWADAEWAAAQVLPLLAYEPYRREILEGAIQFSSSTALIDFFMTLPPLPAHEPDPEGLDLLTLLSAIYDLAKRRFSVNRVFVPLLVSLSSLAESGCLDAVAEDDTEAGPGVLRNLLGIACSGLAKTKSSPRLSATSRLVTAFLGLPNVGVSAAAKLPAFLVHPQHWLRQQTAEELCGIVMALGLAEPEDEVESLLTTTNWTSEAAEGAAQRIVDLLRERLGSPP